MASYIDEYNKKVKEQADAARLSSGQLADTIESAGQQQIGEMQGAQAAQQQAYNTAQQLYQQRMNEGYNQFADIIAGQKRQMQDEQQQAQQQLEANNRAARWTGLTELAAGIANLVGVGAGNAVSQQYKTYSQDWMQKADRDIREHRSRMDNLRERQRALQLQLNQLKMGDAGTALQNAQRMADQAVRNREALAQLRAQNTTAAAQQRAKGESEAAGIEAQGALHSASLSQQQQSLYERQRQFNAEMRAKGLNADGSINEEYMKEISGTTRTGSGSGGNRYNVQFDGQNVTLNMNKETREQAVRDGKEEFLRDIMAMAGYEGDVDDFIDDVNQNKVRETYKNERGRTKSRRIDNPNTKYRDIVNAIVNGDEESDSVINRFYELHRSEMNNVNRRLAMVANGATLYGTVAQGSTGGESISGSLDSGENTTRNVNPKGQAPALSIEDSLYEEENAASGNQPAVAQEEATVQTESLPAIKKEKTNKSGYYSHDWSREPIDDKRFKKAYDDQLKKLLSKAAQEYTRNSGDSISSYYDKQDTLNQAVAVLRRHQDEKGLDNWDDAINSIVKGSDIAQYISSEDRDMLRQMMRDRQSMNASDFAEKYNVKL